MLVLTRKKDEAIIIGDNIEITFLDIKGDQIKIGISAPREIRVLRKEIYLEIQEANKIALATGELKLENLAQIIKNKDFSRDKE